MRDMGLPHRPNGPEDDLMERLLESKAFVFAVVVLALAFATLFLIGAALIVAWIGQQVL